jgi:translocation and assembly module TamB
MGAPWQKHLKRGLLIAGAGLAALMLAALLVFVSPLGRSLAAQVLTGAIAGQGTARYEAVSGAWPGRLVLSKLVLADRDGPWFILDRASLEWRPLALLTGTLAITRLDLDRPVLLREPKAAPSKGSSGGPSFEPPIAVTLDALGVNDGLLQGKPDIGFQGAGALQWTKRHIALDLKIERRGGPKEHVTLTAGLDQATHRVSLALDAAAIEGGLFARLSGMPDLPAFRMTAAGSGPPEAWAFKAGGSAGDYGVFDLNGTLAWTQTLSLDLTGALRPGAALGETWQRALGPTLSLKGRLTRAKGGDSARISLSGEKADAALDASLGAPALFGARTLSGTISLRTNEALGVGSAMSAGPGLVEAKLGGTLDRPSAAVTLGLDELRYHSFRLSKLDGTVELRALSPGVLAVKGKGGIGLFTARGEKVIEAAGWSLSATKDANAIRDAQLGLTSAALTLDAKGALDLRSGSTSLRANLTAADLGALTPIAQLRLAGEAAFVLDVHRDRGDEDAPITLTGRISHGMVAGQALAPFAGAALAVDAALTRHPDGSLTLEKGSLSGDHLTASMSGRIDPVLDLPIALTTDLSALGALAGLDASGNAQGRLHATGTLDDPKLALTLESRAAALEGRMLGTLTIGFVSDAQAPLPAGRLRLQARGPSGRMDLTLPVAEQKGLMVLGPLKGAAYGADLSGTIRETRQAWAGRLDAALADLSGVYSLVSGTPQGLRGRGTASLKLGPSTDMAVSLALRDVMAESRVFAASKLTLDASRKGNGARIVLNGQALRLPGFASAIEARQLQFQGSGPLNRLAWTLNVQGFTGPRGALDARGSLAGRGESRELALDALSGTLWATPLALELPARLTLGGARRTLSPLGLKIGTGRLQLSYAAQGKSQKADLALSAVPLALVGHILGADWPQGRITGQAGLDTLSARPSGFAAMRFSNALFSRQGKTVAEPLSGGLDARWDGRALSVKGEADRMSAAGAATAQPIRLDAKLPLIRKRDGGLGLDPNGALTGEVHWSGRLGTLWALLPYDLHRLDGEATLNGRAFGRWGAPELEGTLRVQNGSYESLLTGTRLRAIALAVDAGSAGGEARVEGGDGRGGHFVGQGHLDFGARQTIKAAVTLSDLRIVGLDRLTAEASGPLALTGSLRAPQLSGTLRIDHVDASIPDRLPPSIPQLSVRYVDETDVTVPQFRTPQTEGGAALGLSLDVDIPGQAFLRGRGLTSEWRGHVNVDGTSLAPRIHGQADLVRGQIAFAGRSYAISRGRVTFDGGSKIDPALDIAATRNIQGTAIALALSGPSSAPRLDLTSSPAMARDQAMSLFLFGKPAQSLTTLELLDVARSLAALTGTTGVGFDPIERTRRALGLDVLTVGVGNRGASGTATDVASSATLEAGRYVSRQVYLGVKQGARAGSSAVQLNYDLTPHLSAGTEVGVESGGQVNLNWKWDY